jgi:hypothetical protein
MPESIPVRISRMLENAPMPYSAIRREIGRDIGSSLSCLRVNQCIAFDPSSGCYVSLKPYRSNRSAPTLSVTPQERQAVYAACCGYSAEQIAAETGINKRTVRLALNRLGKACRVRHVNGRGWFQVGMEMPAPPRKTPIVTPTDLEWQRYWSPENRQQRRIDRYEV